MSDLIKEQSNKKPRLGRGLGSLLGSTPQEASTALPTKKEETPLVAAPSLPPEARIWQVPVERLQSSQFQPRQTFDKESLEELANSIRQSGILQPIVARRLSSGRLEIIAGERRWRAAQLAGLREVPVILKTLTNRETLELAIIENVQREDLNPIEEAEAYQRLLSEFTLTQQQVAEKVGKDRATVANSLRLLQLPAEVRALVSKGELSAGHAKVLLSIQDPQKITEAALRAQREKMSVRKLEKLISNHGRRSSAPAPNDNSEDRAILSLAERLQKSLGTKVDIDYKNGKGKISVHFYSNEGLSEITERIMAGCQKN